MGRAVFMVEDSGDVTGGQVEDLVAEIDGVVHWKVTENGKITVEYDEKAVSTATIEEALEGLGYQIKGIYNAPDAGKVDVPEPYTGPPAIRTEE